MGLRSGKHDLVVDKHGKNVRSDQCSLNDDVKRVGNLGVLANGAAKARQPAGDDSIGKSARVEWSVGAGENIKDEKIWVVLARGDGNTWKGAHDGGGGVGSRWIRGGGGMAKTPAKEVEGRRSAKEAEERWPAKGAEGRWPVAAKLEGAVMSLAALLEER